MKKILAILMTAMIFITTGCLKRDTMEDILIYTSAYPIKYITEELYGKNANIESIYPTGIVINKYNLTDKQLEDYSDCDLFIFNGLSNEKNYIKPMLTYNKNLKIIDASSSIEYTYRMEEMWLDPANFLMTAQNIKNGFEEYVTNQYLIKEIEDNYKQLKINVSQIDAKTQLMIQNASSKTIVVSNDLLKYLTKYGLDVISLEGTDNSADKNIETVKEMIKSGKLKYIYTLKNEDVSDSINELIKDTKVELVEFHTLSSLDETEIKAGKDYITIMNENIDSLKQQLYE